MKALIYLSAWAMLLFSALVLFDRQDMRTPVEFEVLERIDPLPHARALLNQDKIRDAQEYLTYFMAYDYVSTNPEAQALYTELEQIRSSDAYRNQKIAEGVLKGRSDETSGMVAAGVSDLFVFGDIRDLSIEGYHYFKEDEVDEVIVALSTIGLAATAATWFSAGTASPIKGSVSFLKLAKKSGKLPGWLGRELVTLSKTIRKQKDFAPAKALFTNIAQLVQNSGIHSGMKLLSKTTDLKSLETSAAFAKQYGKQSGVISDIVGDQVFILYKSADKVSTKAFKEAATYGAPGVVRLTKLGEKGFAKSLVKPVKTSRLVKVLDKQGVEMLQKIPDSLFWLLGFIAIAIIS